MPREIRRICFVTGTRAEFGLMQPVLRAIRKDKRLRLQIVATGMHLSRLHGKTLDDLGHVTAVVRWKGATLAEATGRATADLARTFAKIKPDIALIVGDRVEALAAATAAHLSRIPVAHVHGGDRALGQVDDSLRHAITKLSHIHFPATKRSAQRIARMGEEGWRIHCVGSPGVDGIAKTTFRNIPAKPFAMILLHPVDADDDVEYRRARIVLRAVAAEKFKTIVVIYPNNDPGHAGIIRCWKKLARGDRWIVRKNIPRDEFLAMLRNASVLVGNSSAGIIEAGSFSTPVVDIGPRQSGRECGGNVRHVPYQAAAIRSALRRKRIRSNNPYGQTGAGVRIAGLLAAVAIDRYLLEKIIAY